jgi:dihydroorotate dehydrogenase (NAD+) catalytic subunit
VGLQNNGIDHVIKYELQELKKVFHKKVIANIAAEDIKGYVEIIKKLNKEKDNIGIFEINVSCPNVKKGALKFDVDHIALAKLIKELKKISKIPLYIKLSPRVSDIVLMAKTCEKAGADGIVLVNTMPGLAIDINTHKPIMGNKIGGLSGPALKSIALRAVYLCYENIKIPIIGCGGITTCEDVIEFMMTGASAVEVGSSNLINPYICKELIETLPNVMKKYNISNIQSIVGIAHK